MIRKVFLVFEEDISDFSLASEKIIVTKIRLYIQDPDLLLTYRNYKL
ncbi:MAG: hypothetical protein PVH48_03585 [Cyclobacteriaceae bacterium]